VKTSLENPPELGRSSARPAALNEPLSVCEEVRELLRCPVCRGRLSQGNAELVCEDPVCETRYPVVGNVPVLINNDGSLFSPEDFAARRSTAFDQPRSRFKEWVDKVLPTLGRNRKANENYGLLARMLLARSPEPIVLVIGGRVRGEGMEALNPWPAIRMVETDVALGPRTQLICDGRDLPFAANSFDGVVVQAVLQYVPDPVKCVEEIRRVLKPEGLVYAETAFMQQVVHGRYDFTRFTHVGLRLLFRGFQEVRSGPTAGPGMVLAWACHFFLLSFASKRFARSLIHAAVRLTLFWLKYFDALLLSKPGTYDAASGYFFLGIREDGRLSDREVVRCYRGAE
jgi:SAM-dependent methyltransferase